MPVIVITSSLKYLQKDVYIARKTLGLSEDEYLESDLIGLDVFGQDKHLGVVSSITDSGGDNKIFVIQGDDGELLIPYNKDFIENVDLLSKKIELKLIEGMIE